MRLLVVEDEVRLAAALQRGLQAEGFTVDIAHDGVDGLHRAREGAHDGGYAAIVLDIMLPGLSGYRVCERLRAEGNWVPVLMLSAKDGEYDEADGLDVGADDYLTKPFSYVVLVARLRALLRRGAPPRPAVLAAGDLALDPAKHQVTRGRDRDRADAAGVLAAGVPAAPGRRGRAEDRHPAQRLGPAPRGRPQRRRGVRRATCAARSTPRSAGGRCRRCAAPATASRPTVARRPAGRGAAEARGGS